MIKKSKQSGFSLIEISIVIAIISILVTGIISGQQLVRNSKISAAKSITLSSQITSIAGMVAWFENSTKDSFDNSESIADTQITTWYNIEPSGFKTTNNLTTSASSDVIYNESIINKLPAVSFTTSGNLSTSEFAKSSLETSTIIIVFRPTSTPSSTAMTITDAGSSSSSTCLISIKNDRVTLNAGSQAETSTVTNPASFIVDNDYILIVHFSGSSSKVFVNDTTEVGGSGATINPGSNSLNGLTLGADKSGANGIAADISEVIIFDRILRNSEREDILKYLNRKYKITVNGL